MASSSPELRCLNCDLVAAGGDIADGWCSGCGKRLPSSYKDALKAAPGSTRVVVIEPEAGLRGRLVCGGIILALLSMLAMIVIQNLFW